MPTKASSSATTIWRRLIAAGSAARRSTVRSRPIPRDALSSTRSPTPGANSRSSGLGRVVGVLRLGHPARPRGAGRLGDPAAALPDRHEAVGTTRAACAPDLAVEPLLVGPELEHVAQDRDPAPAVGERASRPRKSRRRATLTGEALYVSSTIVAPDAASTTFMRCAAWLPASSASRDLVERAPRSRSRHRGGGQRMRHEMPARRAAPHPARAPWSGEGEFGARRARG